MGAKSHCDERAASGNQGGMGMIFREVAAITPITPKAAPPAASASIATSAQKKTLRESKVSQEQRQPDLTNAGRRSTGTYAMALFAFVFGEFFSTWAMHNVERKLYRCAR